MNNKMYYQWKAEGICVLCGKKPAVPGMIYCATCREKELKRKRENWAASKAYRGAWSSTCRQSQGCRGRGRSIRLWSITS